MIIADHDDDHNVTLIFRLFLSGLAWIHDLYLKVCGPTGLTLTRAPGQAGPRARPGQAKPGPIGCRQCPPNLKADGPFK